MIKKIYEYKNTSNEDGSTLAVWYSVNYASGVCRSFRQLSKSAEKFMENAKETFWSHLSPKGYRDSDGVERGDPDATCDYGHTQHVTVYEA